MSSSIPNRRASYGLLWLGCALALLPGCDCGRGCGGSVHPGQKPPVVTAGAPAALSIGEVQGEIDFRRQGDTAWQKANVGQALPEGTVLRAGRQGKVVLVFGDGSQIRVEGEGQLGVRRSNEGFGLRLTAGHVAVSVDKPSASGYRLEFGAASEVVVLREGRTELSVEPSGVRIQMVMGQAVIIRQGQSLSIDAGQSLFLQAPGVDPAEAKPLAAEPTDPRRRSKPGEGAEPPSAPPVFAVEGQDLRVYYDQLPARIELRADAPRAGERVVELASLDREPKLLLTKSMDGESVVVSTEPAGGFLFRIRSRGEEERGTPSWTRVDWRKDPSAGRAASSRWSNVVPDTGVQTTILFQGDVPALTFQWKADPRARRYRIRLYAEEDLERPIQEREIEAPRLGLPAGQLKEGVFFWYQTAFDARGNELASSEMNKLVLAFDNAAPLLRIDSPRPGERLSGRKVRVRGQLVPGARLSVGQFVVAVAADGRFDQWLEPVDPRIPLVFQVKKRGVGRTVFLRTPGR